MYNSIVDNSTPEGIIFCSETGKQKVIKRAILSLYLCLTGNLSHVHLLFQWKNLL